MSELPRPLPEFGTRFPDRATRARRLLWKRWPDGFRCPACGHDEGWEPGRARPILRCAAASGRSWSPPVPCRTAAISACAPGSWRPGWWRRTGTGCRPGSCGGSSGWAATSRLGCCSASCAGRWSTRSGAARRLGRGRRDRPAFSRRGRAGPAGALALRASPSSPARSGWRHGGGRRLARLQEAEGRQARPAGVRRRAGAPGPAPGAPARRERGAAGTGESRHHLRPKRLQAYIDELVFRFDRRRTPHAASDRLLGPSLALEARHLPSGR